jgi:hypothetical protein
MLWDRLFGSFEPEREKPVYGLTKNLHTYNPLRIATHELAAILRDVKKPGPLSQRLGYIFRNPAWKPAASSEAPAPPAPEAARPST